MTGRRLRNDDRQHLKKTVSMTENDAERVRASVNAVYHTESRRILATLIRLLGDFDVAEDALHDAFAAALERWPQDGVPANPRTWLVSTGRFKAIDAMPPRSRIGTSQQAIIEQLQTKSKDYTSRDEESGEPEARLHRV